MEQEGHEHLAEMLKEFRAFVSVRKLRAMAVLGLKQGNAAFGNG